jgi:hypothetical protein
VEAQALLDEVLVDAPAMGGIVNIQRIVSGGSFDFKVIILMSSDAFEVWELKKFEPELTFLQKLSMIKGISQIQAQTYTLMTLYDARDHEQRLEGKGDLGAIPNGIKQYDWLITRLEEHHDRIIVWEKNTQRLAKMELSIKLSSFRPLLGSNYIDVALWWLSRRLFHNRQDSAKFADCRATLDFSFQEMTSRSVERLMLFLADKKVQVTILKLQNNLITDIDSICDYITNSKDWCNHDKDHPPVAEIHIQANHITRDSIENLVRDLD